MNQDFSLRIQVLEWVLSVLAIYFFAKPGVLPTRKIESSIDLYVGLTCGFYFLLAFASKILQFFCLKLHAQDFWLFVDILEHAKHGEYFITHFAPQAWGPVQHGAVHPFIPWAILAPFSILFSPVAIALSFNPIVLALSGWVLDRIMKQLCLASVTRLCVVIAFLFSKQVRLTLMYEVHPEALYPLISFSLILCLIANRPVLGFVSAMTLGVLKVDSFLVLWGSFIASIALQPSLLKHSFVRTIITFGIGLAGFFLQLKIVPYFVSHPLDAFVPKGSPIMEGRNIDGVHSIFEIAQDLFSKNGGTSGTIGAFFGFLTSGSWLGLIRNAPWITIKPAFWLSELPLAFGFSLRGENAILWNYYSMPFVAFIWTFGASFLRGKPVRWSLAILIFSLTNGSEGVRLYFPNKELLDYRAEAKSFAEEIRSFEGVGVVSSNLIPFVPIHKVISDRLPARSNDEAKVQFYFLPKDRDQYGLSAVQVNDKVNKLSSNPEFQKVRESRTLVLFKRVNRG